MVGYFTTQVKLHGQWGPKLEMLFHRAWKRMLGCLLGSWVLMWQVLGTVLAVIFASFGFPRPLSLPTWGLMWMG
jgi:hypothetical protein